MAIKVQGTTVIDDTRNFTNIDKIQGLAFPSSDGTESQVLATDGTGNVSFVDNPVGSGARIAAGDIPSAGTTVILKSDGTVEAVVESPVAEDIGTETVYTTSGHDQTSAVYDSAAGKVVIAYRDQDNSSRGTVIVGTVSGNSISFGSEIIFNSGNTFSISAVYDSAAGKVVIAYVDYGNNGYGTAIVGTVSGNSISFGSETVFAASTNNTDYISATYDSAAGKVVIAYRNDGTSYGTAIVGTVSGSSISFGSPTVFNSVSTRYISTVYDTAAGKVVIAYSDDDNSDNGTAVVGTVSGSSISFGSPVVFSTSFTQSLSATYDTAASKVVIAYVDSGSIGTAVVGTVSGSSISFGSPVVFNSTDNNERSSVTYHSAAGKVVIAYDNNGYLDERGRVIVGTVSGNSISFGSEIIFSSTGVLFISSTYDSAAGKVVIAYSDEGNSDYGEAITYNPDFTATNANDFVGFAQDAASDGDTVLVATNRQIDQNQTGLAPKTTYYVDIDGTLTTSDTGLPVAGFALDSNTIQVGE